jgi:hypothetical protein
MFSRSSRRITNSTDWLIFFFSTGVWTQDLTLWVTPPILFCDGFFWDRVSRTICLGWLWTTILLISTSWIARITGAWFQWFISCWNFQSLQTSGWKLVLECLSSKHEALDWLPSTKTQNNNTNLLVGIGPCVSCSLRSQAWQLWHTSTSTLEGKTT